MKSHGVTIQMKPRYQNFHIVLFIQNVVQTFWSLGMKYYGVTIQMKPFGQNF